MVSAYITAFENERSFMMDNAVVWDDIVKNPEKSVSIVLLCSVLVICVNQH